MEDKSTSIRNSAHSLGIMWGYRYKSNHKHILQGRSLKDNEEKSYSVIGPEVPKFSPTFEQFDSIGLLKSDEATRNLLIFKEQLQVVDANTEAVIGQTTFAIENLGNELLVWGATKFYTGSQVTFISCVTSERFLLTQERRAIKEDVSLFFATEDKGCTLIIKNGDTKIERTLPSNKSENLVGYGNATAISRFLALTEFEGAFRMDYLLDTGEMVPATIEVIRTETRTVVIYRCSGEIITTTELSPTGQMWRLNSIYRHYYFRVDESEPPVLSFGIKKDFKAPKDDMQIRSMYEDRRMLNRAEGRSYVESQPELKIILSNFVQNVLRFKPVNIIAFAVYHFSAFRNHNHPEDEDDPNEPPEDALCCVHLKQFHKPVKYEEEPSDEEDILEGDDPDAHLTSSRSWIMGRSLLSRHSSRKLMISYMGELQMGSVEAIRYIPDDLELHKVLDEQLDKEEMINYFEESFDNDYLLSDSEMRETLKCAKDLYLNIIPYELEEEPPRDPLIEDVQSTRFCSGENNESVHISFDCSVKPYTQKDGSPAVFHNVRYDEWPPTNQ